MKPKRLVFSGGGTRCLVFLTALEQLANDGYLNDVKEYWGTSAGAFLAALLAITGDPHRVRTLFETTDFTRFRNVNVMNLVNITESWGIDDGNGLLEEVCRILDLAADNASKWTMSKIPGLHVVVADLYSYETVVCSASTYPNLRIAESIRASMSLPIFYRPYKCPTSGHVWVDGGLRAAFPWTCLPSDEARSESLGFAFERPWEHGPRTFTEFILSMIHFDDPKNIKILKKKWPAHILWFPSPPFPAWYMKMERDDWDILAEIGNKTFQEWLLNVRSFLRTQEIPRSYEDPNTLLQETHDHHTGGLWDIHQSSFPPPSRALPQDLQPQRSPPSRRWSF